MKTGLPAAAVREFAALSTAWPSLLATTALAVCLPAAAASCIDSEASSPSAQQTEWMLTNACSATVEVTIQSPGRGHATCRVLRMEAGASRKFTQAKVCSSQNQLVVGCHCEQQLVILEREIQ